MCISCSFYHKTTKRSFSKRNKMKMNRFKFDSKNDLSFFEDEFMNSKTKKHTSQHSPEDIN